MTRVKASAAFWLLIFAAIVLAVMDAPAQSRSVNYNPNTGVLNEPSVGATPGVQRANAATHSTDANYTIPAGVSHVAWNVPAQTDGRTLNLPDVGAVTGDVPPDFVIWLFVTDSNGGTVDVRDEASTQVALLSDAATYQFRAKTDGTWQATNFAFGTASLVADSTLVHIAGTETITGAKTFTGGITSRGAAQGQLTLQDTGGVFPATLLFTVPGFTWELSVNSSGAFYWYHNGAYRIYVEPDGDVGINTATPAAKLDAAGTVKLGSTGTVLSSVRIVTGQSLTAGTVTVTDSAIAANDMIEVMPHGITDAGFLGVTINAGVGYTIDSSNPSDARALTIKITEQ